MEFNDNWVTGYILKLEAENKRYRAALEKVLACEWMAEPYKSQVDIWGGVMNMVEDVLREGGK